MSTRKTTGGVRVLPPAEIKAHARAEFGDDEDDEEATVAWITHDKPGRLSSRWPPGLQGSIDEFWQQPICSVKEIEGETWSETRKADYRTDRFEPGIGTQGSKASGLSKQPIPGVTASVDDLAGGLENAVREAIVSTNGAIAARSG